MHMADALISPQVGLTMTALTAGLLGYSIKKAKSTFDSERTPLMGLLGAFVFAGQMLNFAIPATGSSGHISGAILLASILGASRAFIVMACILAIQALFFADGGILALACNIFNLGFWACFIAYPLILKPALKNGFSKAKVIITTILACIVSAQLGSFCVVLETLLSGQSQLSFTTFASLMQGIHLAIGAIEGVATALLLLFLHQVKPSLFDKEINSKELSYKSVFAIIALASIVLSSMLSLYASSSPDGLEWSIEKTTSEELVYESQSHELSSSLAEVAPMPDYNVGAGEESWRASLAGFLGTALSLAIIYILSVALFRKRKA